MRQIKKEMNEFEEQVKLLESQKHDMQKKLSSLEECCKRDTDLFRFETLKREQDWDEER